MASEQAPCSVLLSSMVLILFKVDNFNERKAVHRSKIIYPPSNKAKGSYEDYEDQVECNSGENLMLDKSLVN